MPACIWRMCVKCQVARRLARPRADSRRRRGALLSVVAGGAVLLLAAGCGNSGSTRAAAGSSGSFSAYQACLRQHGASVPTAPPTSGPPGSGGGGFGGYGGGFGGNGTFEKAAQACAALRPSGFGGRGGGFGGPGGGFFAAFQAFRSCMAAHGETIPSPRSATPPASGATGADRFLNGLNPDNPKVAAALKACESKLPSFTGPG